MFKLMLCIAIVGALAATHAEARRGGPSVAYDEAEIFLEENSTDGDLGLHFKVDGEGWRRLVITGPKRRRLVDVRVGGSLGHVIGLTEIFSESAEPGFDELPREDFLSLFPPGKYRFYGRTVDGLRMRGRTRLTHVLPAPAVLSEPEEDDEVDADEDLEIEWQTVADPNPPRNMVEFYEVVVEKDEDDERLRVFSVHMLPTDTNVICPAEFLEPGKDYKVEVIVQETSGNRTSIEVPFSTADDE